MRPRPNVVVICPIPGRTKQSFREQVNINKIVEKHRKTGMLLHVNAREPFYGDVSEVRSYQESLEVVKKAEELFSGMSSQVRERFGNDPSLMIKFLEDPANLEEAVSLGMVVKRKEPEPGTADVVKGLKDVAEAVREPKKVKRSRDEE